MDAIIDANLASMSFVAHLATLNKSKKKWRSAFASIYCSRAFDNRKTRKISPTSSDRVIIINIAKQHSSSFCNVDQSTLTNIVKEKDLNQEPKDATEEDQKNLSQSPSEIVQNVEPEKVIAFSQAGQNAADDQNGLPENLLQSPSEMVLHVEREADLSDLVRLKKVEQLHRLGGVVGIASRLGTDAEKGIQGDDEGIAQRCKDYGLNTIHKQPPKVLHSLLETTRDPIFLILMLFATLALGFGIKRNGKRGYSDGASIFVAAFFVIFVAAFSKLWPKFQLFKLQEARDNFNVSVLRNGQRKNISVFEVVVGDVISLKTGDQVPADGLYINGNSLQVDESNVGAEMVPVEVDDSHNPFLLSGTKVMNGSALMLVTAIGMSTEWGKMLSMKSQDSDQSTPLQKRLHELSKLIAKIGFVVALSVLLVLLIRYFRGNLHDDTGNSYFVAGKTTFHEVLNSVIGISATPLVIAATAIPEGLPLAVLISIAFSIKRMATKKSQVRNLSACEASGSITVICTGDGGNLSLNRLTVTEFCFGGKHIKEGFISNIPPNVLQMLREGLLLKQREASTVYPSDSPVCQAESAIQEWVQDFDAKFPQTLNSEKTDSLPLLQKGEAEAILPRCSHYYDENGNIKDISKNLRDPLEQRIQEMKHRGYQCIAFAHQKMSEKSGDEDGNFNPKLKEENLIFIGIAGLKLTCRPEVRKALEDCEKARVDIIIVTRNDIPTATATAIECGILKPNWDKNAGEVVVGPEFQTCAENEILEKSRNIRVMARATTLDKLLLVKCLKENGKVVAVTGNTIGDAIVLRQAYVGLSLGPQVTQFAKENADVNILDDNFESVVGVLRWGRCMHQNIQLYAQFQLTVSISSLVIDSVTAVSDREPQTFTIVASISAGKVPYAALQVMWVKLIVGTLAAVAITIEEPEELEQLPLVKPDQFVINKTMWRNIVGQAAYPIIILLTIQFKGHSTFNLDSKAKDTMIFNIFVLWQLFLISNSTKKVKKNIFEGMWRRKLLWGIILLITILQVLIVELLNKSADTEKLTWKQWMVCITIAALAWPTGWIIEKINKCVSSKLFYFLQLHG